ncbi:MAG: heavy metal translocating P-type ATPase [Anaerovoracaceae bacterium]
METEANVNTSKKALSDYKLRFIISAILLAPILLINIDEQIMGGILGETATYELLLELSGLPQNMSKNLFESILYGPNILGIVGINYKYFLSGFKMFIKLTPNMDTLIAIGSLASLFLLHFESAGMILTLVTLGKYLEARARGKTSDAIKNLMNITPKEVRIVADGNELMVPISEVKPGVKLSIRSGEIIPVDGRILKGSTEIDESAITGESVPVHKDVGDLVVAGTVNTKEGIIFLAEKVGEDTTVAKIIKLAQEASAGKAPVSKMIDRISEVFVPIVIVIAIITTIIWIVFTGNFQESISKGVAILIISCPCALGLATPMSIIIGTGKAAENGILFKTSEALELAGRSSTIVLDKTGTITKGKPKISDIILTDNWIKLFEPLRLEDTPAKTRFLQLVASLEQPSDHIISKAIVEAAAEQNYALGKVQSFAPHPGKGLETFLDGQRYFIGKLSFLEEMGVDIYDKTAQFTPLKTAANGKIDYDSQTSKTIKVIEYKNREFIEKKAYPLLEQGKTLVFVAGEGILLGAIALEDTVKTSSKTAIAKLKAFGIKLIMLTGDNKKTSDALVRTLEMDEAISEVLPGDKAGKISQLQSRGQIVTMVGNGIKDAAALRKAQLGIAIAKEMDIAIDAADVVLMKNTLEDVVKTVKISRATIRSIKQNLFWAFVYNVIGIPLAAGVLYPFLGWSLSPLFAIVAMALSLVCVETNGLIFRKKRI